MPKLQPHVWAAKREANLHIMRFYPNYKQQNAALGIYSDEVKAQIVTFIQAVRTRCDEYEAAIEAGQTPEINFSDITP